MDFATKILKNAQGWTDCKEVEKNRSYCVDKIHIYTSGKVNNEPWCAEFVWMIVDKTCKEFGIKNTLPRTASTVTLLNGSKQMGIKVNKIPKPGSIMFYPTDPGYGHVGFVAQVKTGEIDTIEGNSGDRVAWRNHKLQDKFQFIHVENMTSKSIFATTDLVPWALLLGLIGYTIYLAKKE